MDNLEKMNKILKRYSLPRLTQEEIENTNRQITSTEIKSGIKNLSTDQTSLGTRLLHR